MQGGGGFPAGQLQSDVEQAPARFARLCEQARARSGGERHRAEQLWVVDQAMPLVGVGPGPVEHILTVGVRLQVQRHCCLQPVAVPQRDVLRPPAAVRVGATRFMQGVQIRMAQKRVVAR
jgi:hypothetical protein